MGARAVARPHSCLGTSRDNLAAREYHLRPAPHDAPDFVLQRCPSYKLPAYGTIIIGPGQTVTLDSYAIFRPLCTTAPQPVDNDTDGITNIADVGDPFHASITPQAYATGAATVISWMLVIMLIITPRTFFAGNSPGRSGLMGRRGIIGGASGGGSVIGVGSRPWLQKVAALTVAVSLTLATADTFRIAARQYEHGFIDALALRLEVVSGVEIKVSRIISDIFLWLAQVQTLIRLFPRHKEKVIIKWVGFALILLDIIFSCLNSFGPYQDDHRLTHFDTAIPALSYLFQLSLSMLYAAWVVYYAITKRRYAFYHPMMWNISVVALFSIVAILTPVVFFITDIANYSIAGWGDYFRWVGAAAASVIVWEWVERIEALEREERKDGILGREIYDGDDMLEDMSSSDSVWPSGRHREMSENKKHRDDPGGGHHFGAFTSGLRHNTRLHHIAHRLGRKPSEPPPKQSKKKRTFHIPAPAPVAQRSDSANRDSRSYVRVHTPPPPPIPVASPVSRTDTTSADSTVYTVRYHPISETPPQRQPGRMGDQLAHDQERDFQNQENQGQPSDPEDVERAEEANPAAVVNRSKWQWQGIRNLFRRQGRTPPQELQRGRVIEPLGVDDVVVNIPPRNYNGLALTDRLGTFAAHQGEKFRSKKKPNDNGPQGEKDLPVTIVPAQPRGQTWSPDSIHRQSPDQLSNEMQMGGTGIQLARIPTVVEEEPEPSPGQSRDVSRSREPAPSSIMGTEVRDHQPQGHSSPGMNHDR